MSSRRAPLSSNLNAANSPIRTHTSGLASKLFKDRLQKRPFASVQREEPYGQPPPAKKKLLNDGTEQPTRSPVRQVKVVRRDYARPRRDDRFNQPPASHKAAQQEDETARMDRWKANTRRNFPQYVFYFESCPAELRPRLVKYLMHLGAREEKFFSKDITHVITSRSVPTDKPARQIDTASTSADVQQTSHDMPRTIDPSLLSRDTSAKDVRRRLLESTRKVPPAPVAEEPAARQPAPSRNTDILLRALEMKKRIWHHSKLQRVFDVMFDPDPLTSAARGSKPTEDLAHMLNKERTNGPSDRDPTVATKELIYFKGPYIYVYDIEEKQKPIMVREYAKVADKKDGDWPQFRASKGGRCPFIEDDEPEVLKRQAEKEALRKERQERKENLSKVSELKPPPVPVSKSAIGKRSLAEMQDGHNTQAAVARESETFDLAKAAAHPKLDFLTQGQNAFTSRARAARLFAGEPVASGMQPSTITSAIRSQMISSATGFLGGKAGTSKELQGLQRKVLQKSNATPINSTSQDISSRRQGDMSVDTVTCQRSASFAVGSRKPVQLEDKSKVHKRTLSVPAAVTKPKKRDLKPGYCENCQDKYNDFDEHILSKKHRKFAENDKNWAALDSLLSQLKRVPKYADEHEEELSIF